MNNNYNFPNSHTKSIYLKNMINISKNIPDLKERIYLKYYIANEIKEFFINKLITDFIWICILLSIFICHIFILKFIF